MWEICEAGKKNKPEVMWLSEVAAVLEGRDTSVLVWTLMPSEAETSQLLSTHVIQ